MKERNIKSFILPSIPLEELNQAITGKVLIKWNGQPMCLRLTKSERSTFEDAKEKHYLIQRSTKRNNLTSAYWHWCEAVSEVYICIKKRRRYASLELDMITKQNRKEKETSRLTKQAQKEVLELIYLYYEPGSSISIGDQYISVSEIIYENAEKLASLLYPVVTAP